MKYAGCLATMSHDLGQFSCFLISVLWTCTILPQKIKFRQGFGKEVGRCKEHVVHTSRLADVGYTVGIRLLEYVTWREKYNKKDKDRDNKIVKLLLFISTTVWKTLFNKEAVVEKNDKNQCKLPGVIWLTWRYDNRVRTSRLQIHLHTQRNVESKLLFVCVWHCGRHTGCCGLCKDHLKHST